MKDLIALLAHHGYAVVFWVVFAEAIGLPMPAALALVGAGAALASGSLGFVSRDFLAVLTRSFQAAGRTVKETILIAILVYVLYRIWLFRKYAVYRVVPRVQVEELARKLTSDESAGLVVMDVRSHGYYDADTLRIKGSIRLEPNNLSEELKTLPKDKDIYVYCT